MKDNKSDGNKRPSTSFITGAIALAFLIIGYQTALFLHRAATLKIISGVSAPDTVFVSVSSCDLGKDEKKVIKRSAGKKPEQVSNVAASFAPKRCETFEFNPNTVSVDDLCRLGFTLKQAKSIDSYRRKGGRFRRKSDFAKSFVVADSVYKRLESSINIPLLDLNTADSAAFDDLPGIGGYFASKMVAYRTRLGGYSFKEQLMEIYHFDEEKYMNLRDLVEVRTPAQPFALWTLPADSLRMHPYVGNMQRAKAIILYRENNPRTALTIDGLVRAGIIDKETGSKLSRCRIEGL